LHQNNLGVSQLYSLLPVDLYILYKVLFPDGKLKHKGGEVTLLKVPEKSNSKARN